MTLSDDSENHSAYAALLSLIYIFLAIRVIRLRRQAKIALGSSGNRQLERAIRVHANFAEYVPLALLMIAFVEMKGYPAPLVHALGITLNSGRALHAFGVSQEKENFRFRVAGISFTFAALMAAATTLLVGVFHDFPI